MKKIKALFIPISMLALLFVSCDKDDPVTIDPELIGTWFSEIIMEDGITHENGETSPMTMNATVRFSSDNTGNAQTEYLTEQGGILWTETNQFTYEASNGKLRLQLEEEENIVSYKISGNQLSLVPDDGYTTVYTRM